MEPMVANWKYGRLFLKSASLYSALHNSVKLHIFFNSSCDAQAVAVILSEQKNWSFTELVCKNSYVFVTDICKMVTRAFQFCVCCALVYHKYCLGNSAVGMTSCWQLGERWGPPFTFSSHMTYEFVLRTRRATKACIIDSRAFAKTVVCNKHKGTNENLKTLVYRFADTSKTTV